MSPLFLKQLKSLCSTPDLIHSFNVFFPNNETTSCSDFIPWLIVSSQQIVDERLGVVVSVEEVTARAIRISGKTYLTFPDSPLFKLGHSEFLQIFLSLLFPETVFERGSGYLVNDEEEAE